MKYFENLIKKACIVLILFVFASCQQKEVLIEGTLNNLPDGIMYLCKDSNVNKIDSVETKNGKFTFKYKLGNEPIYFALHHIDKKNTFRMIGFPTKAKYNNCGYCSSVFMSDSIVVINGSFTDDTPVEMNFGGTRLVTTPEVKAGYQTNALFHTDGDLFSNINESTYSKVLSKIKEYPNSFHLLYSINDYRNSFSAIEVSNFLKAFKGEIVDSDTFLSLKKYNEKRIESKRKESPFLSNQRGQKKVVLDTKFNKHLVVFWASWCGPCRQEIPLLKKIYDKYKNDVDFVSVSTDSDNALWHKALEKENMPWNQFILDEKSKDYESVEIFFQLSKSIPYLLIMDNNMKVVKSHVGLMTEKELNEFIKTQ